MPSLLLNYKKSSLVCCILLFLSSAALLIKLTFKLQLFPLSIIHMFCAKQIIIFIIFQETSRVSHSLQDNNNCYLIVV